MGEQGCRRGPEVQRVGRERELPQHGAWQQLAVGNIKEVDLAWHTLQSSMALSMHSRQLP